MKEIDFLPQWYKTGQKRQVSYRRQHIAIIVILSALTLWGFATSYTVSRAGAKVERMENEFAESVAVSNEYNMLKARVDKLKTKAQMLKELEPRLDCAAILAELSYLGTEGVILQSIEIEPETYESSGSAGTGGSVRLASRSKAGQEKQDPLPEHNVRYKLTIKGIARDATNVADMISRLETSEYFRSVVPGFSKNKDVKKVKTTEFSIDCYIANYSEVEREENK
jgi:Tfp pilus assembly protein PilN